VRTQPTSTFMNSRSTTPDSANSNKSESKKTARVLTLTVALITVGFVFS
jgi:hypothetical protein